MVCHRRYEGEWKDGLKQGKGHYQLTDGSFYKGEFLNGARHGHGVHEVL